MARIATYLDANAGAPLRPEVVARLRELLSGSPGLSEVLFPNASSIHSHGRRAKKWLAEARDRIALSLGEDTDPEQILLTSSGTEANQLAIRSALEPFFRSKQPVHWITSTVEHDSVLQMKSWVESRGGEVTLLEVNDCGAPDISKLRSLIRPGETRLVSLIWVNNETGVVTDAREAVLICESQKVPLHLDAAQAWGKLAIHVSSLGAKWVTFSSHKIGALGGVGVLWLGRGSKVDSLILGKQEKGRRAGTENLMGIISTGEAAASLKPASWDERVRPLRDRLEREILDRVPGARVNGAGASRVANTLNVSFSGLVGEGLILALDMAGYSVSSGSACSSGAIEPSHVLLAMGRSKAEATSAIRLSLADVVAWDELEGFVQALEAIVARMRSSETRNEAPQTDKRAL